MIQYDFNMIHFSGVWSVNTIKMWMRLLPEASGTGLERARDHGVKVGGRMAAVGHF